MRICKWHLCNKEVIGRSDKEFCDRKCKNKWDVKKRRHKIKAMSVEYLGGSCKRCGWCEHQSGLVPHHMDESLKAFAIGGGGHTRSWDRVKVELDKCILLCSNCHNVVHATRDPKWIRL